MREIKYMAYWHESKLMTLVDTIEFLEGGIRVSDGCAHTGWADLDCTLRQFTGLKDEKGFAIFEGAIINCHIVTPKKNWKELREVAYDEDMARFAAVSLDGSHSSSLPSNVAFNLNPVRIDKCAVIGDIYKNSELLPEVTTQ